MGFLCLIVTRCFNCCVFSQLLLSLNLFCHVMCSVADCVFGCYIATRSQIQFLLMLPYSKGNLISVRKLLGAEKFNVIVHLLLRSCLICEQYVPDSLSYHKLVFQRGKFWWSLCNRLCYLLFETM